MFHTMPPANPRPQADYDPDELPTHYTPDQAVAMIQGANKTQKPSAPQKNVLKPPLDHPQQRKASPRLHHPHQPQPQPQPHLQPHSQPQSQNPYQHPHSHPYPQHTRPPPPSMNHMQRTSHGMMSPNNNHGRPAPAPLRGPPQSTAPYSPPYQSLAPHPHSQQLQHQHQQQQQLQQHQHQQQIQQQQQQQIQQQQQQQQQQQRQQPLSPNLHQYHHASTGSMSAMNAAAGPGNVSLTQIFHEVNVSGGGTLTETELVAALVRLNRSFDPATVRMLIGDFANPDRPANGVDLDGFYALWDYLRRWRELYYSFDYDGNGRIGLSEFGKALYDFGYRLRPPFVSAMFTMFETRGRRRLGEQYGDGISFDLFVQVGLFLSKVTNCFIKFDKDRDGYITLGFEEFLHELLVIVG